MLSKTFKLSTEDDTKQLAEKLASMLSPPLIIGFSGALGAGKTTCIRAALRALGVEGPIKSPTFAWVETYPLKTFDFHHFDLYRLSNQLALESLGFRDYFLEDSICCIEWPDKALGLNEHLDMLLSFSFDDGERNVVIEGFTPSAQNIIKML